MKSDDGVGTVVGTESGGNLNSEDDGSDRRTGGVALAINELASSDISK